MISEAKERADKKYNQSKKGKIANARYKQTEKSKITQVRYDQSEKGKIVKTRAGARYRQTKKGKIADARKHARRKRDLGFKSMNNWFPGCNGHHIDGVNVLFIPKELHKSIKHSQNDPVSMKAINIAAFEWLCTQEII